ncbi:TIR domain-containing protein [Desulfovibrio sp. OttesenSCG-928-G15]|nr:TIR domain-containing protein [Desulfovibrio sp. OttesenSCG-928-G15]
MPANADILTYDVFFSYARADNANGGIDRLVQTICTEYAAFFPGQQLSCFFDTEAIQTGDDWRNRLYTGLKQSRMMISMLSENYLASEWCRKEWEAWCEIEKSRGWLSYMLCPVYYVEVPGSEERIGKFLRQRESWLQATPLLGEEADSAFEENACLAEIVSRQAVDLKAWYTHGEGALRKEGVRTAIAKLAGTIHEKSLLSRNAELASSDFIRANANFCGRVHELKNIRQCFTERERGTLPVLHGPGGEGKSALALAYAHAFAYLYPGGRFRVNCEGLGSLKQCFVKLGEEQGLEAMSGGEQGEAPSENALHTRVWDWLSTRPHGRSFVILDNISDEKFFSQSSIIEAIRPTDRVHVLATTRCSGQSIGSAGMAVPVNGLCLSDGMKLLYSICPYDNEQKHFASNIVRLFGGHALSLELTASFLRETPEFSYQDFTAELDASGVFETLEQARESSAKCLSHDKILSTQVEHILTPALAGLSGAERTILRIAALFAPDAVPEEPLHEASLSLLPDALRKKGLQNPWKSALRKLCGLALLQPGSQSGLYRMHRMIREVVLHHPGCHASSSDSDKIFDILQECIQRAVSSWRDGYSVCPHAQLCALVPTLDAWLSSPVSAPHALPLVRPMVEYVLRGTGRFEESAALVAVAHNALATLPETDEHHLRKIDLLLCQGHVAMDKGDLAQSELAYNSALAALDELETLAAPTENTAFAVTRARCLDYLGTCAKARQGWVEASELHERSRAVLEAAVSVAGIQEHDEQLRCEMTYTLDHLAQALEYAGQDDFALEMYEQSLRLRREMSAASPQNTRYMRDITVSLDRIGNILLKRQQKDAALRHYGEALSIAEALSAKEPDNMAFMRDYCVSLNKRGNALRADDATAALTCYDKALALRTSLLEREPDNLLLLYDCSYSHLLSGDTLLAMGKTQDAQRHLHTALDIRKKLCSQYPGSVRYAYGQAVALERLASLYGKTDEKEQAIAFLDSAIALLKNTLTGLSDGSALVKGALQELEPLRESIAQG